MVDYSVAAGGHIAAPELLLNGVPRDFNAGCRNRHHFKAKNFFAGRCRVCPDFDGFGTESAGTDVVGGLDAELVQGERLQAGDCVRSELRVHAFGYGLPRAAVLHLLHSVETEGCESVAAGCPIKRDLLALDLAATNLRHGRRLGVVAVVGRED